MENQHRILTPFQRKILQKSLETSLRPEYHRRIEIMLLADTGYTQAQICEVLRCSHETARYWITIAQSGNALQWSDRPLGRPKTINDQYRDRLKELVSHSPREFGYAFRRWTARWLARQLEKELGINVSSRYINYLLKEMGLSTRDQTSPDRSSSSQRQPAIASDMGEEDLITALLETG
ncbi:MAG: helix-turn-helix domain-containing protein [Leptolyngbyaceae cyanobacterium RU_5_1]|nr:helix-turn-helix domain-containing protein [Leptolyngbyaceae cyanobacterium RU_5_1]